jgi:hypothetical protein
MTPSMLYRYYLHLKASEAVQHDKVQVHVCTW